MIQDLAFESYLRHSNRALPLRQGCPSKVFQMILLMHTGSQRNHFVIFSVIPGITLRLLLIPDGSLDRNVFYSPKRMTVSPNGTTYHAGEISFCLPSLAIPADFYIPPLQPVHYKILVHSCDQKLPLLYSTS